MGVITTIKVIIVNPPYYDIGYITIYIYITIYTLN